MKVSELRALSVQTDSDKRLTALLLMRKQIEDAHCEEEYLSLARSMIEDEDNSCRWQALIVVGEYIRSHPETVWEVVEHYGVSDDEDMRAGVATVLLEHLIEFDAAKYRPRAETLAASSSNFADTLGTCWSFDGAD